MLAGGMGNERLTIDNLGNAGIRTISPTDDLHVEGDTRITVALKDSNNDAGTSGQVLSSTATGTDWINTSSTVIGSWIWEEGTKYLIHDLGFVSGSYSTIPFNTTPIVVNTSANPAGFAFNATNYSVTLEAGKTYKINADFSVYRTGGSVTLRLVDVADSTNVLMYSANLYSTTYSGASPSIRGLVVPTTTADYVLQAHINGTNASLSAPSSIAPSGVLPAANIVVEKLLD